MSDVRQFQAMAASYYDAARLYAFTGLRASAVAQQRRAAVASACARRQMGVE